MTTFAFILHPIDLHRDVGRKYPFARFLPTPVIEALLKYKSPQVLSEIRGVRSITGKETKGWFIGCPLSPRMMTRLPLEFVYGKIVQSCELAARQGAKIVGLGAFTAVVGDRGITVAKRSPIAVTTGNSYTVASAIEGALKAAALLEVSTKESILAVVGATGSIGRTCAILLVPEFAHTILIGRDFEATARVASELGHCAEATTDIRRLKEADVVITVTSSETAIIQPEHLKSGAIVCDVARPRDVSVRVREERGDVLIIEGGLVEVPGDVDFGFDFGFPPRTAYACMAETMILALEDRCENYTLGRNVSVEQVREMQELAKKHGFRLAGFRSFEKEVSQETIARVKHAIERRTKVSANI